MLVRYATSGDSAQIWRIIGPTIRAGETYTLPSDMTEEDALAYWLGADKQTFVAEESGQILGTYYLRANQQGVGAHVCYCGYMTEAAAQGRGIARALCLHSQEVTRAAGYCGMQFNFVVSSNTCAVRLWEQLGFAVVGRLPLAFNHPTLGYLDALAMFKSL